MFNQKPILSICLPTNGVVEWVLPTLRGIYSQNVDQSLFEVVLTDNGKDSILDQYLSEFAYANLRYIRTTDSGFLNLMTSLRQGKGLFCKMLNHRSILTQGALQMMIDTIIQYQQEKPILYFMDGKLGDNEIYECESLDEFVRTMHYWTTWSAGVGVWQDDIPQLETMAFNATFPQSALMFDIRPNSKYVINNVHYQDMQNEDGKGGYDLFQAFAVEFPEIWQELVKQGRLSKESYDYAMSELYKFIRHLYGQEVMSASKHTFIIRNVGPSIVKYFGLRGYLDIYYVYHWDRFKKQVKKILKQ